MAEDLNINRCWFHKNHYDIPLRRIEEIMTKCTLVTVREIVKKMKKLKPILKFNNGRGAILCHGCSVIIKANLTQDEWEGKIDLFYCDECIEKNEKRK